MTNCEIYRTIEELLAKGESTMLLSVIEGEEGAVSTGLCRHLTDLVYHENEWEGRVASVTFENGVLLEPMLPAERLLLLGAGHVAKAVASFAAACGFLVTVCDDRAEFVTKERFPDAKERICASFGEFLAEAKPGAFDYVVIVTRGHEHDAECLRCLLLGQEPSYTGLIGSRSRVKKLFEQLADEGYSKERMARICTPIGLAIGAKTPEEIAVSITAELIAYRRLAEKSAGRSRCSSDLEIDLIGYLAENNEPAALATILDSRGSTPRRAGAKMLVAADGSIRGTIGGGYAENAIREEALSMIGSGRYRILTVDMSGQIAKDDGMVCGGRMRVLIEDLETIASGNL